jgi:hypothetical protein
MIRNMPGTICTVRAYPSRILRPCDGETAEIHDYHDEHTGVLAAALT